MSWQAKVTDECNACGSCQEICPMEALVMVGEQMSVSRDCIGCGLCALHCPEEAIVMEEIGAPKEHLLDYFKGFRPQI